MHTKTNDESTIGLEGRVHHTWPLNSLDRVEQSHARGESVSVPWPYRLPQWVTAWCIQKVTISVIIQTLLFPARPCQYEEPGRERGNSRNQTLVLTCPSHKARSGWEIFFYQKPQLLKSGPPCVLPRTPGLVTMLTAQRHPS